MNYTQTFSRRNAFHPAARMLRLVLISSLLMVWATRAGYGQSCTPTFGCRANAVYAFCDPSSNDQDRLVQQCSSTQSCVFDYNVGPVCIANPAGRVWQDSNRNGVQDAGELGIQGATVTMIHAGANGIFGDGDDRTASAPTNSNGVYLITPPTIPHGGDFLPITAGNVRFVVSNLPAGYRATFDPDSGTTNPDGISTYNNVAQGMLVTNVHFGFYAAEPPLGPGAEWPATSIISSQQAGSVLIYNVYTSAAGNAGSQNTRLSMTNTHLTRAAYVHLFFVDGNSCSVADSFICLTPNQTASFLASDLDPGTTGYVVAVATDRNGCPTPFNYLIGDEYVKFASGHAANLGAEAVSALAFGNVPVCNGDTAQLNFDGMSYGLLPRVLAASSLSSRADNNDTLLIVNRIGGSLISGAATINGLFGLLYDDAERGVSFQLPANQCQYRTTLNNELRVTPRYEAVIPAGRTGWMKLWSFIDAGILGVQINRNANAASNAGAFNQGHNLHKLTLTNTGNVTIPIFPPGC